VRTTVKDKEGKNVRTKMRTNVKNKDESKVEDIFEDKRVKKVGGKIVRIILESKVRTR
jgi:hypothetical protein